MSGTEPAALSDWERERLVRLARLAAFDVARAACAVRGDAGDARPRPRPPGSAIRLLLAHDKIDAQQKRAADEIMRVFEGLTAAVCCKVSRISSGFRGGAPADWPSRLTEAYMFRYCPWREAINLRVAGQQSLGSLVLDVVVDDAGLRSLKARYRCSYDALLLMLVEGLELYVAIAAWRSERPGIRAARFGG